ncbi:UPF0311 protein [Mycolicibacterium confluentis]|uniref:UPF0311 protein MCNF_37390 n=2 Tax=Mycolicibacterium confluentis TaxID=28047 RepID=A0A7I7Y1B8_9MYCO|nr:UPF0311 protein [Mycolicibacterium confluentis]
MALSWGDQPSVGGAMGVELSHEFTFWAQLNPAVDVGPGPLGQRLCFEVVGGEVTGERLKGEVLSGGGDWILVGADGYGRIDVRLQFKTFDGASIFVQYFGLLEINEVVASALATGGGTRYEDQYFRTAPRLETGDPRYSWVNRSTFVARGHAVEGGRVEYEVHRVL